MMVPSKNNSGDDDVLDYKVPPYFTLLRITSTASTPLDQEQQQTYFDLHKKQISILDPFTDLDLQWGALKTSVLGMFYNNPQTNEIEFSGDVNDYVSAHNYRVYSPTDEYLDIIVNSMVSKDKSFAIGKLRLTECQI
jgi:hypothetical protein